MLELIFGFGYRVKKLRRRWDRLREKTLGKKDPMRSQILERLDTIENNLKTLEETKLTRVVRARMAKEIEIDLEEVAELLKFDGSQATEKEE
ncbi:MAG: hypothetical protein HY519_03600 [Candidatus Aenigmarchaeota archaeon]|nr:hypothetical protein [Candidatus Aenigmarchaeota archaeon]